MIPSALFMIGAESQERIAMACDIVCFYNMFGHDPLAANLQWNTVMKSFEVQWKALKERKGEDPPEVLKITKSLPIIKMDRGILGLLKSQDWQPLAYVIHDDPTPNPIIPSLAPGQPHSADHKSVEA